MPVTRSTDSENEQDRAAEVARSLRRWFTRAAVTGVIVSLLIHATGLLGAAFWRIGGWRSGGPGEGASQVGSAIDMAVVSEGELTTLQESAIALQTPSVPDATSGDIQNAEIVDTAPGGGEGEGMGELGELGPLAGGGDVTGAGDGTGGGGGGGGANFFGLEARGNRFAYIVDVSGSMGGKRIETLRRELGNSIKGLLENSQFVVVQFDDNASIVGERQTWTDGTVSGKRTAEAMINTLNPGGGTNPLPAVEIVFKLRPRPDAIYFMTDGEFPAGTLEEITRLNKTLRIPIHTICFGSQAGQDAMRKIAQVSRGKYTFVPEPP